MSAGRFSKLLFALIAAHLVESRHCGTTMATIEKRRKGQMIAERPNLYYPTNARPPNLEKFEGKDVLIRIRSGIYDRATEVTD